MPTTRMDNVAIPENAEWLTLKQGAVYAQVSYARFTTAVKEGLLPCGKVPYAKSRGTRVKKGDIDEWLRGGAGG